MTNITARTYYSKTIGFVLLFTFFSNNSLADVVLDGTMGTTGTLSGNSIEITSDMGATSGNNLFHSFQTFDLTSSQTANFSGPASVQNIIGRVTGGPSSIDGTITSSINGANLYLLNPNGILFGANATIDISGSFHATIADSLRFTDDLVFYADPTQDPILSSASPAAFGFLTNTPAAINVEGLYNAQATEVSLVGGDINITNPTGVAYVENYDGQINLTSVASQGEVSIENDIHQLVGFTNLGTISFFDAQMYTAGDNGGKVVIRGGSLVMDFAVIAVDTEGAGTDTKTVGIDIDVSGDVILNATEFYSYAFDGSIGDANDIKIKSDTLIMDDYSFINTSVDSTALGNGGDIIIENNRSEFINSSVIETNTNGAGNSGDIIIDSENSIDIRNGSKLISGSNSEGNAGNVTINTSDLTIENDIDDINGINVPDDFRNITGIYTFTGTGNSAGANVNILTNNFTLHNFGFILTKNSSLSNNSNIGILATETLNITNGAYLRTISTSVNDSNAGDITIDAATMNILGGIQKLSSHIASDVSNNSGDSGTISINSSTLTLKDGAHINTTSLLGENGEIIISANDILISGYNKYWYDILVAGEPNATDLDGSILKNVNSHISTTTPNSAITTPPSSPLSTTAGKISITANSLRMTEGGSIYADTQSIHANAGSIDLNVANIDLSKGAVISSSSNPRNSQSANPNLGNAGTISITSENLSVDGEQFLNVNSGILSETTFGGGNAADITVSTNNLLMSNGANISSSSENQTNSGNITLSANNELRLQSDASITTSAKNTGKAGDIKIYDTGSLVLSDNNIISSTANQANSGSVNINTSSNVFLTDSAINTDVASSTGNGGDVTIITNYVILDSSEITTTAIAGNGGNIAITANSILKTADSDINADSKESIDGNIDINALVDVNTALESVTEDSKNITTVFANNCVKNTENNSHLIVNTSTPGKWKNNSQIASLSRETPNKIPNHSKKERYLFANITQNQFECEKYN